MSKRKDPRPVCTCSAYPFPHRVGGKCKGYAFAEFYFYNIHTECNSCNFNGPGDCDVVGGLEPIKEAECYIDACHYHSGEHLPLKIEEPEEPEQ